MKRKILRISGKLFLQMFAEGDHKYKVIKNAMPDDAKIIDCKANHFNDVEGFGSIDLLIESSSFEEIKQGKEIPFFDMQFQSL